MFEREWGIQPWGKGRVKKQSQNAPQTKALGDLEWEKQDRQDFLSSPSMAEAVVQAWRALSVKYGLKVSFAVFSSLILVPNLKQDLFAH